MLGSLPATSLVVYDSDLRFEFVSGTALSESGISPDEIVGRSLTEVVPGEQGEILAGHYRAALAGEERRLEYTSTRDGRSYCLHVSPLRERSGEVEAAIALSLEIGGGVRERELWDQLMGMSTLASATRSIANIRDRSGIRARLVQEVRAVAAAGAVVLLELKPDGSGVPLASAGTEYEIDAIRELLLIADAPAKAIARRAPVHLASPPPGGSADASLMKQLGAGSILWYPMPEIDGERSMLAVGWAESGRGGDRSIATAIGVLTGEATSALHRAKELERLTRAVRHDDVTGMMAASGWEHELGRELALAAASGREAAIAMLEIDHFEVYLAENGGLAADRMLKRWSAGIGAQLELTDRPGRIGEARFGIVVARDSVEAGYDVIETLRDVGIPGVTTSAGAIAASAARLVDDLLAGAERALAEAQLAGGDRTVVATHDTPPGKPDSELR